MKVKVSGIWEVLNNPSNYQGESLRKRYLIQNAKEKPTEEQTKHKKRKKRKESLIQNETKEPTEEQTKRKKDNFIQRICAYFGVDKDNPDQVNALKGFIAQYAKLEELGKVLFGQEFVSKAIVKDDANLEAQFKFLNEKYGYFTLSDFKNFKQVYEVCLYVAQYIKNNNNEVAEHEVAEHEVAEHEVAEHEVAEHEVAERAYKAMVLFGKDPKNALQGWEKFMGEHASNLANPIHDIFIYDLPKSGTFTLRRWQSLIKKDGMKVVKALPNADKIEAKLGKDPKDVKEMSATLAQLSYARGSKKAELANLCYHYSVSKDRFNRILDLIADGTIRFKEKDSIPEVFLDIEEEVDPAAKNQYLVKLPANDPRAMILGDITNCCQSIGGDAELCVIDGITMKNQAFYVLISTKNPIKSAEEIKWDTFEESGNRILGQGYVWRSEENNLVFDSWENKGAENDDKIVRGLPVLAQKMMAKDHSISRVLIGKSRKTPKTFKDKKNTPITESIKEGYQYTDSYDQVEIAASVQLLNARGELREKFSLDDTLEFIVSVKQAEECNKLSTQEFKTAIENRFILPALSAEDIRELSAVKAQEPNSPLCSENALSLYKDRFITLNDFLGLNPEQIKALTSYNAIEAYKTGQVTVADLKDFEVDKINALASYNAIEAYKTGQVTVADLKDFEVDKINALTSWSTIIAYRTGKVTFAALQDLEVDKIEALTSYGAQTLYKANLTFADPAKDNTLDIGIKIIKEISKHICHQEEIEISDTISAQKIEALTSYGAAYCYENGKGTVAELKDFELDKIKVLTSDNAIKAYKTGQVTVADLKDLDAEKFEALTSFYAIIAYNRGAAKAAELKDFEVDKIKALTSEDTIKAYRTGKVTFAALKDLEVDKIEALTSEDAIEAYRTGKVTFAALKDLEVNKIKALTSEDAIEAYRTGKVTFAALKELGVDEIKDILTSDKKKTFEKNNKDFFSSIFSYSDTLTKFTTSTAINAYETNGTSLIIGAALVAAGYCTFSYITGSKGGGMGI
ncbi:MAG: hypothetical protein K0R73_1048 [Candidatus Midichloriaceae bacterium]|jgi:GTP cyclohydrolase II|nr:hypothetical protein [Candidatus Midichloriaceae bacterium]